MTETTKSTPNLKLRYERERRAWSQQDVADKVGTTPLNVGRWERGITTPGPYFRQKLCEVFEKSTQELGFVVEHIDPIKSVPSPQGSPTADGPTAQAFPETAAPLWNVPYNRNLLFTGREAILGQLHRTLTSEDQPIALAQPQAISGLGGIGKTQTAMEYAYRYRDNYQIVLWARADSYDLLVSDFMLIAAILNLSQHNEQDQNVVVKAVMQWFDSHENWLLILDNADDVPMVSAFIPSAGKGHVLLTTRSHSTGTVAQRVELDKMDKEEGTVLLLRRAKLLKNPHASLSLVTGVVRDQAEAIVEAVDGLPLALDQAGAYIEETGCSLSDYLKFYKTKRNRLLRTRGKSATGHPEPVATTWSLSFEKVEQANPAAAELLRLCAFLHPDEIPEAMIIEGAAELGPILQPVAEDEFELNEAIGELRKYSLIKRDPELKLLNIHRLVQAVIKDSMDKEMQKEWAERTVRMVSRVFPKVEFELWSICQQFLPHAQLCAELMKQWDLKFPEAAQLLQRAGNYLRERAQYGECKLLLEQALRLREQIWGAEHLDVADSLHDLALLYYTQSNHAQAEPIYRRAIAIREHALGPEHPDLAESLNNLGELYNVQGKYAEAEPLYRRALIMREHILGPEHSKVINSLNNLAWLYVEQNKYSEAEQLLQRALAICEKTLGPDHPDAAVSFNGLAWFYYSQNKYDQAVPFLERALSIREQMFDADHPEVATSLNNLGLIYYKQGNYEKAEPMLIRSLNIWKLKFGTNHSDTAQCMSNLASLYRDQGKYDVAIPLFLESIEIAQEHLGPEHPNIAKYCYNLGHLYILQGDYTQAETYLQRALAIRELAFGPEHLEVAYTLNNLATLYTKQKRYSEAESLYQRALTILEHIAGVEHPDVTTTLINYAGMLRQAGREMEAKTLEERAPAIQTKRE